jgi:hypothetical protein
MTMSWSLRAIHKLPFQLPRLSVQQHSAHSEPENYSNCDLWTVHRQQAMEMHTCVAVPETDDVALQTHYRQPSKKIRNRLRNERNIYEVKDLFELRSGDVKKFREEFEDAQRGISTVYRNYLRC